MRFSTTALSQEQKHSSIVSCVAWLSNEEIYSCGDDHCILRWSSAKGGCTRVAELAEDVFPTSMHVMPRPTSSKKTGSDLMLLLTCADGKMLLLSASGRIEKSVEAHKAAILCSQLSRDGSSVVTGAEDGAVKVWSRSAMLRTTVAPASSAPVFACDWAPDSQTVAFAQAGSIVLKPLSPSLATNKWQAHDGVILSLAWSAVAPGTLVSGAEDCRYKVWDAEGRLLFSSGNQGAPVSGVAWSWNGQLLAVGVHHSLRLCHASGWSHSVERLSSGGVHGLAWSRDNSQVAVACGAGHVLAACVVGREVECGGVQAEMTAPRAVRVRDLAASDVWESLETKSAVLLLAAGMAHVAVATATAVLVFSVRSLNTPAEIKLPSVFLLQLTAKGLLAVSEAGLFVFTLEGRPVSVPRIAGLQTAGLTELAVSLAPDTLAVRDHADHRVVHVVEVGSLRGADSGGSRLQHAEPVRALALSQTEAERCLALVDARGDLFVAPNPTAAAARTFKLTSMVRCVAWNWSSPYLAALTESHLTVWFYPHVAAIDRSLLHNTLMERDLSDLGSGASISQFCGGLLEVRRADQVAVHVPLSPAPAALYQLTERGQWEKALALLRRATQAAGMRPGCLHSLYAARCRAKMQPTRALVAYAALGSVDTVEMLMAQQ